MKLTERIRNFFYAATHSNQLVTQNRGLTLENDTLSRKLMETKNLHREATEELDIAKRQRHNLTVAIKKITPRELSLDTLRSLCAEINFDPYSSYHSVGDRYFRNVWHARFFLPQELGDAVEQYTYCEMLASAGILPEKNADAYKELLAKAEKAIGERFLTTPLPADMPIGRIDYLGMDGIVGDSQIFNDAGEFVCTIMGNDYAGVPTSVTVYSDPQSGSHLDISWQDSLEAYRGGLEIRTYDPIELTDLFPREALVNELSLRRSQQFAIESFNDHSVPGNSQLKYHIFTINLEKNELEAVGGSYNDYITAHREAKSILPGAKRVSIYELSSCLQNRAPNLNCFSTVQIQQIVDRLNTCSSVKDCNIPKIMSEVAQNAWDGSYPSTMYIHAGSDTVVIKGYTYEPGYEDFSATASISLNGVTLYGLDSRNVDAYKNETYHIGIYKTSEEAIAHIEKEVQSNSFTISASSESTVRDQYLPAQEQVASCDPAPETDYEMEM